MSGKKLFYGTIFVAIVSLNFYYTWDAKQKCFEVNLCTYKLTNLAFSTEDKIETELEKFKSMISNSEDSERLGLATENLELRLQNKELMQDLLNMLNLLKGHETLLNDPHNKTKI